METFALSPIGRIQTVFKTKFGVPRQPGLHSTSAWIELFPQFQPELSLQGFERFSHVWVIYRFHLNGAGSFHAKVHPPRLEGQSLGVFATRSPHRPNSLGLSVCRILEIQPRGLVVEGLDAVDGSPVFDLKPYLPEVEAISTATGSLGLNPVVEVTWSEQARLDVEFWKKRKPDLRCEKLVEEVLSLDPRPRVYRGYEESSEKPYRSLHRVYLDDVDVHFSFVKTNLVRVERIVPVDLSQHLDNPMR